jgi:hypothetical protein
MRISIANYDLLFPMDVDKKRIHLAVMNKERLIKKVTLPYDPNNLFNYVRKSFAGQKGVCSAGVRFVDFAAGFCVLRRYCR